MATRICRILLSMVLLGGAVLVGGSTSQADPSVPGKSVSTYATLDKPGFISFGSDGSLYVGNDVNSGSDARIWRISPGGLTVTDYGVALPDPHAVAYDANGTVSGVAGTVWAGADLRMAAMTEDSAVKSFNASDPFPILVPGTMRESVGCSLAGPEGGAQPRPQDQPASPPGTPRQLCLPVWPRTPRESASGSRCAAGDGCTPAATRPGRTGPRAGSGTARG